MFRLKTDEAKTINRSQIVTGSQKHRDPRFPPQVFTQEGGDALERIALQARG